MTLRPATADDASSIAALSMEVWLGTYLKRGINGFFAEYVLNTFTTAKTKALLDDPDNWVLVSENADGIDGFIRVARPAQGPVDACSDTEIATFYVQPRHHGKGIGRALLNAALAQCRAVGAPSVWLATNAENTPAIAFYLRHGFTHAGETHFEVRDQAYLNNVYIYALT